MIAPRAARPDAGGVAGFGLVGDLTPLIDVLFMLIVFMVLTANASERALDAGFASTEESLAAAGGGAEVLQVTVGGTAADDPAFAIDGDPFAAWPAAKAALSDRLTGDGGERPVHVAVAADAPAQRMIDLMAFLQTRGVADAQIVLRGR